MRPWDHDAPLSLSGPVSNAGSSMSEASAKNRSVFPTLDAEPSAAPARGPARAARRGALALLAGRGVGSRLAAHFGAVPHDAAACGEASEWARPAKGQIDGNHVRSRGAVID